MIVQVSVSLNIFDSLSYRFTGDPDRIKKGYRVVVPVGNRPTTGWVVDTNSDYKGRVKNVLAVVEDDFTPGPGFMDFVDTVSRSYFTSVGSLLDGALPPARKPQTALYFQDPDKENKAVKLSSLSLVEIQKKIKKAGGPLSCFYKIQSCSTQQRESDKKNDSTVEPDSEDGDKMVLGNPLEREKEYATIIEHFIARGKSVIIAVPDNLTAAYIKDRVDRMETDCIVAVYNSDIKTKERDRAWYDVVGRKRPAVIIGGQTAVLLPVPNLGAVICDRSGSSVYGRTFYSPYNVAVMARMRAHSENVPLVEGFPVLTLNASFRSSRMEIVDQRTNPVHANVYMIKRDTRGIPPELETVLNRHAGEGTAEPKKILVILNKNESGFFLFCPKCKTIQRCPSCNGYLEVSQESEVTCRRCSFHKEKYDRCPQCGESHSVVENISVASVKKLIKERISETGIATMSSDGLKQEYIYPAVKRIKESNIVVSTPVIVNPFFSRMFDAVIYIRPESLFNLDAYDAAEKVFSMVAELRELVKPDGSLEIFSTFHFHYSLKLVNEESKFIQRELNYREWFHLPPFANVYHIEVRAKDLRSLGKEMREIYKNWNRQLTIKQVYLQGRKATRGIFKGTLEIHALPDALLDTRLVKQRDVSISLVMA